jgi:amino-acid N-acetyltransferase
MIPSVTPARPDDAEAVAALLTASALPLDGALASLDCAVVARLDTRLVGCAALELYGPDALLRSVAVDGALHGRGVGRRLVAAALDLAQDRGAATVYLLTTTAEAFFHHLGFERVTREVVPADVRGSLEFTSACPGTATVMRKRLARASRHLR